MNNQTKNEESSQEALENAPTPADKKWHFTEELEPYGKLECYTIYGWYDGPLLYLLENEQHLLFVYWVDCDNEKKTDTFWYLPISEETRGKISRHEICLRKVLENNAGEAITFGDEITREPLPVSKEHVGILLPEYGLFLEEERAIP